jgi:PEGA domain
VELPCQSPPSGAPSLWSTSGVARAARSTVSPSRSTPIESHPPGKASAMPACPRCASRLMRTHRTALQRMIFVDMHRCPTCAYRLGRMRALVPLGVTFVVSRYTRCIKCGTADVHRLAKRDRPPAVVGVAASRSGPVPSTTTPRTTGSSRHRGLANDTTQQFVGFLAVESVPARAAVFINQQHVGETPLHLTRLRAGSHAIRIEHEGYERWTTSVLVPADTQTRVSATLQPTRDH